MKSELSIITVNYFSANLVNELAKSMPSKNTVKYSWIVVDNSNDENEIEKLSNIKNIDIIINPKKNLGFGKANNLAVKKSKSKYLLFLNPDTSIDKLDFSKLISVIDSDTRIKMVGPKTLNYDGSLQLSASKKYPNWWSHKLDYSPALRVLVEKLGLMGYPTLLSAQEHEKSQEVVSLLGASMMMIRADFNNLGGFDEDFFMYREETDLAKRITSSGGAIYYFADTHINHASGGASNNSFYAELNYEYSKSAYIFLSKWHGFLYVSFCWLNAILGLLISSILFGLTGLLINRKRNDYFKISRLCLRSLVWHIYHPFGIGCYRSRMQK